MFCLLIASVLWLAHALNRNYSYTLTTPVKFINLPSTKILVGDLPETINIDIKTSGLKLLFIILKGNKNTLEYDFDVLKKTKSQHFYFSSNKVLINNHINFDFEILKIRPDTLYFSSQNGQTKLIPVKVNLDLQCKTGFSIISKPTVTPAYITISGDSTELKNIDTVYTQFTKLVNVSQNYSNQINLSNTHKLVYYNPKTVAVSFNVDRLIEHKISIPISITNQTTNDAIKILPQMVDVTYLVSMQEYELITENLFKASVNYNQINSKNKLLDVTLTRTPSNIKIISVSPKQVSYLIFK